MEVKHIFSPNNILIYIYDGNNHALYYSPQIGIHKEEFRLHDFDCFSFIDLRCSFKISICRPRQRLKVKDSILYVITVLEF